MSSESEAQMNEGDQQSSNGSSYLDGIVLDEPTNSTVDTTSLPGYILFDEIDDIPPPSQRLTRCNRNHYISPEEFFTNDTNETVDISDILQGSSDRNENDLSTESFYDVVNSFLNRENLITTRSARLRYTPTIPSHSGISYADEFDDIMENHVNSASVNNLIDLVRHHNYVINQEEYSYTNDDGEDVIVLIDYRYIEELEENIERLIDQINMTRYTPRIHTSLYDLDLTYASRELLPQ